MVKFSYYKGQAKIKKELPTSFSEFSIETWLKVYELMLRGEVDTKLYISLLSETDYEDLEHFPITTIISLTDTIRFLWESEAIVVKDIPYEFKPIGALQYLQFEDWKVKYAHLGDADLLIPYTVAFLYSGDYTYQDRENKLTEIKKLPANIGIYCKNFYNISFAEHQKNYAPLYQGYEPEVEEEEAGYSQLSRWGYMGTLEALSSGDILKQKDISKMCVDDVYTHLSYQKTEAQYIKNYRKILENAVRAGHRID